jgi:hypothetical protein
MKPAPSPLTETFEQLGTFEAKDLKQAELKKLL